jgi:hypothetical protein
MLLGFMHVFQLQRYEGELVVDLKILRAELFRLMIQVGGFQQLPLALRLLR